MRSRGRVTGNTGSSHLAAGVEVTITLVLKPATFSSGSFLQLGFCIIHLIFVKVLRRVRFNALASISPLDQRRASEMSTKRGGARKQWPSEVFDYVSLRITDPDVAELDMACGTWVRCGKYVFCRSSVVEECVVDPSPTDANALLRLPGARNQSSRWLHHFQVEVGAITKSH